MNNQGMMNDDPAMGTGTGMQQPMEGHHHKDHHKKHEAEAAGVGILGGAGIAEHEHHKHKEQRATDSRVDTPAETTADKIKKHLPGTEAHKEHKAHKDTGMTGGTGGAMTGGAGDQY
ncbi:g10186 [Coccomyxa viridis]|uniref:G10186 protein n=1 Tax=Coccomyxa viridis TaxID=1274662 RepID=A0ABP1G4P6_9CHLO